MTPQEILNKCADDFEKDPKSWTKGAFVTDEHGRSIGYTKLSVPLIDRTKFPEAACFCAVGKIYQIAEKEKEADETVQFLGKILKDNYFPSRDWFLPQDCVVSFNDALNGPTKLIEEMREAAKK